MPLSSFLSAVSCYRKRRGERIGKMRELAGSLGWSLVEIQVFLSCLLLLILRQIGTEEVLKSHEVAEAEKHIWYVGTEGLATR